MQRSPLTPLVSFGRLLLTIIGTPVAASRRVLAAVRGLSATDHGPLLGLGAAAVSLLIGASTIAMGGIAGASPEPVEVALARTADATATLAAIEVQTARIERARTGSEVARLSRVATAAASRAATEERIRLIEGTDGSRISAWPAQGAITGRWAERRPGHYHAGIDIDGNTGDPIYAAGPGVVTGAGYLRDYGGYGNVVLIQHANGYMTLSAHLSSVSVGVGDTVEAGQVVGRMGCTGHCFGSHLHFEVRKGDRPVNPHLYLP